ncbi:hypothetical protein ES703_60053 [subsurface metagenome]
MPAGIFFEGIGAVRYLLLAIMDYALSLISQAASLGFFNILHVLLSELKEEMAECEKQQGLHPDN